MDDDAPFTDPPQCMPDYCKGEDTVLAYQNYYILEKSDLQGGLKEKRQYFLWRNTMRRESYWDYMARRLREDAPMLNNSIHRSLHLKLDDHEKRRVTAVFDQVDILKKEVSQLQESLQNSYIRIKELKAQVDYYEKRSGPQLEFKF